MNQTGRHLIPIEFNRTEHRAEKHLIKCAFTLFTGIWKGQTVASLFNSFKVHLLMEPRAKWTSAVLPFSVFSYSALYASHLCFILARRAWVMEARNVLSWVKCYPNTEFFLILWRKRKSVTASHAVSNRTNTHHIRARWCIANLMTKTRKFSSKKSPNNVWQCRCVVANSVFFPTLCWPPGIRYPKKIQHTHTKIHIQHTYKTHNTHILPYCSVRPLFLLLYYVLWTGL